jgi:hypothetical protein
MEEQEIEQVLRDDLERHAAAADVTPPVADRARADVARRRRTRWGAVGAAAAVVLVVGGVAVATRGGSDDARTPPTVNEPSTTDGAPGSHDWRTEYWGGVAVDVPAEWGYGGAPIAYEGGGVSDVSACYPEAMVAADGRRLRQSGDRGWVGRPIAVTDVCAGYPWIENSPQEEPAAPYVWLGAAVEPGVVEYGNGVVEETIEVDGVTVTAGTADASLRARILASARTGDLCAATAPTIPGGQTAMTREGRGELLSAKVCAYHREGSGGDYLLSYASVIDNADAEAAFAAAEDSLHLTSICDAADGFEFIVLRATYDDLGGGNIQRSAVYDMGCQGSIKLGSGDIRDLTPEAVAPWADNGIPAVVYGPTGGKGAMIDSFIGPQG